MYTKLHRHVASPHRRSSFLRFLWLLLGFRLIGWKLLTILATFFKFFLPWLQNKVGREKRPENTLRIHSRNLPTMVPSHRSCCCNFCNPGIDILQLPHLSLEKQHASYHISKLLYFLFSIKKTAKLWICRKKWSTSTLQAVTSGSWGLFISWVSSCSGIAWPNDRQLCQKHNPACGSPKRPKCSQTWKGLEIPPCKWPSKFIEMGKSSINWCIFTYLSSKHCENIEISTESTRPAPAASSFFVQSEHARQFLASFLELSLSSGTTDSSCSSVDDSSKKSQEQQEKTCPYAEVRFIYDLKMGLKPTNFSSLNPIPSNVSHGRGHIPCVADLFLKNL